MHFGNGISGSDMRRTAAVKRRPPQIVAQAVPFPAPTGGWDAISPVANMPIDRAVQLDNWIPRPGYIEPRPGFIKRCTGVGDASTPVQTVMAYNGFNGTNNLFAAAGTTIYDCSNPGVAVATSITTLSNSRLQYLQFSNPSSVQYLVVCNGVDAPLLYDGSSWTNLSVSGSGVTPSSFIQVAQHKGRLWFVQANSTNPVYMTGVGTITGSAATFPLGQLMSKGGNVVAIGTWTIDTRQTVDEYMAFVTSRGQVIVYAGTDPSTSNTWSLVGRYDIGRPIGTRCLSRISGDLLIITIDGVIGMSEMLSTDRAAANRVSLTSKILNKMAQSAQLYFTNFGWQIIEYAKGTLSILNIPQQENVQQYQYAMNTITGAWCQFIGINANCWEVDAQDNVFFGGNNGTVFQWDVGAGDDGKNISCIAKTAYNPFGSAPQRKRYTALQPLITTTGVAIPSVGINVDFKDASVLSTEQPAGVVQPEWDQAIWDQFVWPQLASNTNNWIALAGTGYYVSIVTQVTTQPNRTDPTQKVVLQLNGWNITAETGAYV